MITATLIVAFFATLKFVKDAIIHHDSFRRKGFDKFWWKETAEKGNGTFTENYFPMFFDAWHLCEFLQVTLVSFMAATFVDCNFPQYLAIGIVLTFFASLLFNVLYEAIDK